MGFDLFRCQSQIALFEQAVYLIVFYRRALRVLTMLEKGALIPLRQSSQLAQHLPNARVGREVRKRPMPFEGGGNRPINVTPRGVSSL